MRKHHRPVRACGTRRPALRQAAASPATRSFGLHWHAPQGWMAFHMNALFERLQALLAEHADEALTEDRRVPLEREIASVQAALVQ